ncbi:hypothetical protein [Caenimonas aquaedulcis]|uniref:Uncharacterized protein n=1 Tax=Caenimonas aquaedulcis TaxID=2793270 RepID=A0A931MHR1_9BURK|nr:hypothetical protein [Caenimonas aquaedulcis]MBG9389341.1 hypothetical protein [Caenimonas aquaedulcis]
MAEARFPSYFPGHRTTLSASPFSYRYYPQTGTYLGVVTIANASFQLGHVYVAGAGLGTLTNPTDMGSLENFIKPLECPGGTFHTPPTVSGTALLPVCNNVYIDPSVPTEQWAGIIDGINVAIGMNTAVYGALMSTMPDVIVCESAACGDYFAGPSRRNTTLYPNTYAGTYVAPRLTVVLTSATWTQNPYVLAHEFSHVEVSVRLNGQHVPAWFDEGLATYLAGEPICTNVTGKGIADLRTLDDEGDWVAYTGSVDAFFKTYCQAGAEVGAWVRARDSAAIGQLLQAVRQGQSFSTQYGAMMTQ